MARTYLGIIQETEKGKAPALAAYECTASSERAARSKLLLGAADLTPASYMVELLCISRLKKGVPVKKEMLDYKTDTIVILKDDDADSKSVEFIEHKTWNSNKDDKPKAKPGQAKLSAMFDDELIDKAATPNSRVAYGHGNEVIKT